MRGDHLTDEQLQQFTEAPGSMDPDQVFHIRQCANCKSRALNYSAIYAGLDAMEKPAFDFDLAELVLEQLPSKKTKNSRAAILSAGFGTVFIILILLIYSPQLFVLFRGLSSAGLYMMVIPALVVSLLQGIAYLKEYKQRRSEVEVI